jgi:hypothetical protein
MKRMSKIFLTIMVMGISILPTCSSSSYYQTGDVMELHRHSVGNGIAVVILGDGFDREDCRKGGVYEDNCRKLAEVFLAMPVVRDFKEYFDVLARVDVSADRGARNCVETPDRCPDNAYGAGHPDFEWDKMHATATLVAGKDDRSIIYMANGMVGGHVIANVAVYSANEPNKLYWMMHEFAGHVLGGLPDLYYIDGENPLDEGAKKAFDEGHKGGSFLMFDWTKDPERVFWKDFIGRPGYEKVGVYPAAIWGLKLGEVTTCEDIHTSVMFGPAAHFTVMERYQLWWQIQTRAGFPVSLDRFIEYDAVNLSDTDLSWAPYKPLDWTDNRIWSGKNER